MFSIFTNFKDCFAIRSPFIITEGLAVSLCIVVMARVLVNVKSALIH